MSDQYDWAFVEGKCTKNHAHCGESANCDHEMIVELCPYALDIGDEERMCDCCECCRIECAMDI